MTFDVNFLAIAACAVANMAIGFVWYSMPVFGRTWLKLIGKSEKELKAMQKSMGPGYGAMVLSSVVTAFVLAQFVGLARATTIQEGIVIGFWAWLGFAATLSLQEVIFAGKNLNLYFLNNGYNFISLAVMGAILAVWV